MLERKYERCASRVGIRILQLRRELGLHQRQVALLSGINPGYLSLVENGQRLPSFLVLSQVAKILQVPLHELFALV